MPVVSGRAGPRGPRLGLASSISSSWWILSRDTTSLRRLLHGGFLPLFRSVQSNSKGMIVENRDPSSFIQPLVANGRLEPRNRAVPAVPGVGKTRGGSNRYGRGRPSASTSIAWAAGAGPGRGAALPARRGGPQTYRGTAVGARGRGPRFHSGSMDGAACRVWRALKRQARAVELWNVASCATPCRGRGLAVSVGLR